tara:strand:- start:522 stop:1295 length:774 start_codon:yes stop_codon:yes gene_type:complete
MLFYTYPKKQGTYLIYTSKVLLDSTIFKNLYIQLSPKNSFLLKQIFTKFGRFINSFFKTVHHTPHNNNNFIGLIKNDTPILFEIKDQTPIKVWRLNSLKVWIQEDFIGYQLLSEYSKKEYFKKKNLIKESLKTHWELLISDINNVHGDLTHFNILYKNDKIFFIDKKSKNHSKLFDFFYFYTYLHQCFENCQTITSVELDTIINDLSKTIVNICQYKTKNEVCHDINTFNIPNEIGIKDIKKYKLQFENIFTESFEN